jgi:hypothetical protein
MADVFISYKSERVEAAARLADVLNHHGYTVWWDYRLAPGSDFGEIIERELRRSKAVVVLWCPLAVKSRWVRAEASLARALHKFIPVEIEEAELPLPFYNDHTINLIDWDGVSEDIAFARLLRDVGVLVGRKAKASPALRRSQVDWEQLGSHPLRTLPLGARVEPSSPPRIGGPASGRRNALLLLAFGAIALLLLTGAIVWPQIRVPISTAEKESAPLQSDDVADSTPPPAAEQDVALIAAPLAGRWAPAGVTCRDAVTMSLSERQLSIDYGNGAMRFENIEGVHAGGAVRTTTADGETFFYSVHGDELTLRTSDAVVRFQKCAA